MNDYIAVYVSGDGARVIAREIEAKTLPGAARVANDLLISQTFGQGAVWGLCAIVEANAVGQVAAMLEAGL